MAIFSAKQFNTFFAHTILKMTGSDLTCKCGDILNKKKTDWSESYRHICMSSNNPDKDMNTDQGSGRQRVKL